MSIPVNFSLKVKFRVPAEKLFQALIDWEDHANWIPFTNVTITISETSQINTAHIGQEFCARTGIGPLAFDDNMRVIRFDAKELSCEVEKIGPFITGLAGFKVESTANRSHLIWYEKLTLPLPTLLSPILSPLLSFFGSLAFRLSMRNLASHLK